MNDSTVGCVATTAGSARLLRRKLTSSAATLALAAYFLGRRGLWIALILSLFSLLMRALLYRRHTVLSSANLGATVELAEALSLVLLASF